VGVEWRSDVSLQEELNIQHHECFFRSAEGRGKNTVPTATITGRRRSNRKTGGWPGQKNGAPREPTSFGTPPVERLVPRPH